MTNPELSDVKLKDLLTKYLNEINQDIVDNITDTSKVMIINKYRNMLTNIIKVCEKRNKF